MARFLTGLGGPRLHERFPGRTFEGFLEWKYFANPVGDAIAAVAVEGKRIVGMVAATPKALWLDGEAHVVYELGDFLTDDAFRGRGIFSQLINATCEELTGRGAVLAYVRPNENSFPILVGRCAFTEPYQLQARRFVFPSDLLARRVSPSAARFGSVRLDRAALRLAVGAPRSDVWVRSVDRLGAEHDQFWQTARVDYRLVLDRASRYLNWRYANSPTPFLLWHARRDGRTVGFAAAFVSRSSRAGYIGDLFTSPHDDDACQALMTTLFETLRDARIGRIYAWRALGKPQSAPQRSLIRACPLRTSRPMHVAVRILDREFPGLPPSGWHLSMGDFDGL